MQTDLILKNLNESIHLELEEANFFCSLLEEERIKRKGYLLKAGSVCRYQYFVVEGCLKVGYWDTYGVEHVVKFAIENWWALDLESFATNTPAFYTIQALEDTRVLKISRPNMDIVHERIPAFEKFSRLLYQNAYIALQRRITQNLASKAEERYQHFLEKYPGLNQRISQKYIASYLGITPEFLSMLRRKELKPVIS